MAEVEASAAQLVAALCALAGSFFFLAGAIGLLRLPDLYTRSHAPAKAATLGILFLALASALVHARAGFPVWIEDLLLIAFVFLTVPVSTQILVRAAAARGIPAVEGTRGEAPREPIEEAD